MLPILSIQLNLNFGQMGIFNYIYIYIYTSNENIQFISNSKLSNFITETIVWLIQISKIIMVALILSGADYSNTMKGKQVSK